MQKDKNLGTRSNLERPKTRLRVADKTDKRAAGFEWRRVPFAWLPLFTLAGARQKQSRQHQDCQLGNHFNQFRNAMTLAGAVVTQR